MKDARSMNNRNRRVPSARAILIGTSQYEHLPWIPAAANSIAKMHQLLTSELCAWNEHQIEVIKNPVEPTGIAQHLIDSYADALDVALFYYVGHGQRDEENKLCLGLVNSQRLSPHIASTSLQFDAVRRALKASKAAAKIVILDCCYSGLTGAESDLSRMTGGTYIVAATKMGKTAKFDTMRGGLTYFTRHFASVIEQGIAGDSETLTLDAIVGQVAHSLGAAGLPVPTDIRQDLHGYAFARNQACHARSRDAQNFGWRIHDIPPPPHQGAVTCMAISRSGDLLATGGADSTVVIHAIAPDMKCSATRRLGESNRDRQANLERSQHFRESYRARYGGKEFQLSDLIALGIQGRDFTVTGLAIDPQTSKLALSGGPSGIGFWRGEKIVHDVGVARSRRVLPAFSPSGRYLVSAQKWVGPFQSRLLWWDDAGRAGTKVNALGVIHAIAIRPVDTDPRTGEPTGEEMFACGYEDGTIRLWCFEHGQTTGPILRSDAETPVHSLAFSPDGRSLAAVNDDGLLSIWPIAGFEERIFIADPTSVTAVDACRVPVQRRLVGESAGISVTAYSPDGAWLATGHWDGNVRLWDPAAATEMGHGLVHSIKDALHQKSQRRITSLVFSPDSCLLIAGSESGQLFIWRNI
jgi:WD40 repeat protein